MIQAYSVNKEVRVLQIGAAVDPKKSELLTALEINFLSSPAVRH